MSLYQQIRSDIKSSLKEGKKEISLTLRGIDAIIQLKAKESKSDITDDLVLDILIKSIKQRKDSIDAYSKANRVDLVMVETFETNLLEKYLPVQLSENELKTIIDAAIVNTNAESIKDMGKVMAIVMKQTKGKADGKTISNLVKEMLK